MPEISFAAIDHNYRDYLGRCDLDVDLIPKGSAPAAAYNEYLETATGLVCFLHADTTTDGLEAAIGRTIDQHGFGGALGVVGAGSRWARKGREITAPTCDGCLIVVDADRPERFDAITFDGFHLYAEDFCCQVGGVRLIDLDGYEWRGRLSPPGADWFCHHSQTLCKLGGAWGDYAQYKQRLNEKWGSLVATT